MCYIRSCCCGCKPLNEGVFLIALLSLVLEGVLVVVPWLVPTRLHVEGLTTWLIILCATDIILACGAKLGNKYLLVPWLVAHVMQTILSFLVGPILLGLAAFMRYQQRYQNNNSASWWDSNAAASKWTNPISGSGGLNLDEFIFTPVDPIPNIDTPIQSLGQWNGTDWPQDNSDGDHRHNHDIGNTVSMVVSVVLPPWYIYCLVAVASLYMYMEKKEHKDRKREPRTNRFSVVRTISVVGQPQPKPIFISGNRSPPVQPFLGSGGGYPPPSKQMFIAGSPSPPAAPQMMMTPYFPPPSPARPSFQPMPVMQPLRPMYLQQEQSGYRRASFQQPGGYNSMPPPAMQYYHM